MWDPQKCCSSVTRYFIVTPYTDDVTPCANGITPSRATVPALNPCASMVSESAMPLRHNAVPLVISLHRFEPKSDLVSGFRSKFGLVQNTSWEYL